MHWAAVCDQIFYSLLILHVATACQLLYLNLKTKAVGMLPLIFVTFYYKKAVGTESVWQGIKLPSSKCTGGRLFRQIYKKGHEKTDDHAERMDEAYQHGGREHDKAGKSAHK